MKKSYVRTYSRQVNSTVNRRNSVLSSQAGLPLKLNYWSIDRDWVASWNQATTISLRVGLKFRRVLWSETNGTAGMLLTPTVSEDNHQMFMCSTAPKQFTDVEGQIGAVYQFRRPGEIRQCPTLTCTKVFHGTELFSSEYSSNVVVASFIATEK